MDLGRVCDTEHAKMLCVCQWVCVCCVRGGRYGLYSIQWNAFNVGLAYTIQYFWKGAAKKLFQSMKAQSPSLVAVFASPINCCCTLWWTSTPQYMYLLQSSYSKEPEIANRSLPRAVSVSVKCNMKLAYYGTWLELSNMRNTPLVWFRHEWLVVKWLTHCTVNLTYVLVSNLTCFLRVRPSSLLLGDKPLAERA